MAKLIESKRREIWQRVMRAMSDNREATALPKDELLKAVVAIDDWVDANMLSLNAAIPALSRGSLSAEQKARLLWLVIEARFNEKV